MKRSHRFAKFEPITVRAAARVLHLERLGRLAPQEVSHYMQHLAAMDTHATSQVHERLSRVARRRSCLGNTGVPSVCGMARRERRSSRPDASRSRFGRESLRLAA